MKILMRNKDHKDWEVVDVVGYSKEAELQKLLAQTPSLIAIDEVLENSSPLVAAVREVGLPGSGSTDILAFNEQGDIVVVECKLAANPEIKRKVIAQVLEYGSFLWNMSYEDLDERIYLRENRHLAELVGEAAGTPEWDEEQFRLNIEENLSKGKFVLTIAVDEMNEELLRTMKFLNTCGNPTFAFTVLEMRRFNKDNTEILVPHLHGTYSQPRSSQARRGMWTETEYFEQIEKQHSPELVSIYRDIYNWMSKKADRAFFGTGREIGSVTFHYLLNGKIISVFSMYTNGSLAINYGYLIARLGAGAVADFHAVLTKIDSFAGIPADFNRWPSVNIGDAFLMDAKSLAQFKRAVEDFGEKIRS